MSYMEHFKFRTQPFSEHAGKDSLWRDGRMEEGLSRLQHLVAIACLLGATAARSVRIDDQAFHLAANEVHWN